MIDDAKKPLDQQAEQKSLQNEGTREFDEAISGKGPVMPKKETTREEDADLNEALEGTFPASDPVSATSAETKPGAPKGKPAGTKAA
jgi:hypothetical protein